MRSSPRPIDQQELYDTVRRALLDRFTSQLTRSEELAGATPRPTEPTQDHLSSASALVQDSTAMYYVLIVLARIEPAVAQLDVRKQWDLLSHYLLRAGILPSTSPCDIALAIVCTERKLCDFKFIPRHIASEIMLNPVLWEQFYALNPHKYTPDQLQNHNMFSHLLRDLHVLAEMQDPNQSITTKSAVMALGEQYRTFSRVASGAVAAVSRRAEALGSSAAAMVSGIAERVSERLERAAREAREQEKITRITENIINNRTAFAWIAYTFEQIDPSADDTAAPQSLEHATVSYAAFDPQAAQATFADPKFYFGQSFQTIFGDFFELPHLDWEVKLARAIANRMDKFRLLIIHLKSIAQQVARADTPVEALRAKVVQALVRGADKESSPLQLLQEIVSTAREVT